MPQEAAKAGHELGIDISDAQLKRAMQRNPGVPFIQADLSDYEFPDGQRFLYRFIPAETDIHGQGFGACSHWGTSHLWLSFTYFLRNLSYYNFQPLAL